LRSAEAITRQNPRTWDQRIRVRPVQASCMGTWKASRWDGRAVAPDRSVRERFRSSPRHGRGSSECA